MSYVRVYIYIWQANDLSRENPVINFELALFSGAFILDVGDEVYVWEGWMPAEITKDKRGSAKRRWDEERKLTLETTLSYVKGK